MYRHCEERSDEAIQRGRKLDCFAALAMTPRFDDTMIQGKRTTPNGFGKW